MAKDERFIKYLRPPQLFEAMQNFNASHSVTRGEFSIKVPSLLQDMEWNQMDQLHRPHMHHTYQESIRIALGRDFASSLTRWGRWPFYITVTDMRVDKGVYYSNFTLAGVLFVHNIITFTEENEVVTLKHEWFISSHWLFKPLHYVISRMWYNLNVRLQQEDALIRAQRYKLRKQGYSFLSDSESPDFCTANMLTNNTVYPELPESASIDISALGVDQRMGYEAGAVEFIVQRKQNEILVWPSACPHEGGELAKGKLHDDCRMECPWHGLKFNAARLSEAEPTTERYGFVYTLKQNTIAIRSAAKESKAA